VPKPILYHAETDLYLEYSTVVDAPTTIAVPRDEMRAYLIKRDGDGGDDGRAVDERLDRAKRKGSSAHGSDDLRSAIICNRAGRDETEMSFAQFERFFFIEHALRRAEYDASGNTTPPPAGDLVREYDEHGCEVSVTIGGVPVAEPGE
jgi:hypothetical protein